VIVARQVNYPPRVVPNYVFRSQRKVNPVATKISGVQLGIQGTAPNQTVSVQVGPNGYSGLPLSGNGSFFDRVSFDADHLFGNIRLHYVIGNFGTLWSQEFVDSLNANGVATTAGDFYNVGFEVNDDGSYTISFGSAIGGAVNQTITTDEATLTEDTYDQTILLKNIGAFLRRAGFSDLTTPAATGIYAGETAIQAVAGHVFVY
jgi:hypothetical protein